MFEDGESVSQQQLIEIPLENYYNIQYYAKIYVGSEKTPLSLIFDTGSSILWIPDKNCKGCHESTKKYDQSKSMTYQKQSSMPTSITYGTGEVWGYPSDETICFDASDRSKCMFERDFLLVFQADNLTGLQSDGVLGLSPRKDYGQENKENFIESLYEQGLISHKIFSFNLGNSNEDPKIIFGGFDMKYAKPSEEISWHKLTETLYWTLNLQKAQLGSTEIKTKSTNAIIDSGSSYILVPQNDFDQFQQLVSKDLSCQFDTGKTNLYSCKCWTTSYDNFPPLKITIDDTLYEIPSTSYMQKNGFTCYFKVVPQQFSSKDYWILGDVFIQNYYSIFDYENQLVGLVKSNHVDSTWNWRMYGYILSLLLAIIGVVSYIYQCIIDRKAKRKLIPVTIKDNTRYVQV